MPRPNQVRLSTSTDADGRVVIEIADTGQGMPGDVGARLFTPFFTTKPVGIGTGLGLSICHRIVTGLGGTIDVSSEVSKGSSVRVSLVPTQELKALSAPDSGAKVPSARRARILLIDDEVLVATPVRRVLARQHDVETVTSAHEALKSIKPANIPTSSGAT